MSAREGFPRVGADDVSAPRAILALNAGSSSLKFALFEIGAPLALIAKGEIENLDGTPHFVARGARGAKLVETRGATSGISATLEALLKFVEDPSGRGKSLGGRPPRRAWRGRACRARAREAGVTPGLGRAGVARPTASAAQYRPIRALAAAHPRLAQVACFDTAFHHTMLREAAHFALPRALTEAGARRYGFHGLSYEYIVDQMKTSAPTLAAGPAIVAHLGAGANLCAVRNGVSIATTMSFSPLDGLVMATRCGALDPAEIKVLLYRQSGLIGVSGISADMRVLIASDDPRAREAPDLFTYLAAIEIAAMAGALGGLDGLVFTAGIGERAPTIRAEMCAPLAWLGVRLDAFANAANAPRIGAPDSLIEVRVIATDEEAMIAQHTLTITKEAATE